MLHLGQPEVSDPSAARVSRARCAAPIAIRSNETGQITTFTPTSRS